MNFSKFFVDRPIFAGVLSTLILLIGIISIWRLPISEYPEVVPPSVVVRAQFPGAGRTFPRPGPHLGVSHGVAPVRRSSRGGGSASARRVPSSLTPDYGDRWRL